MDQATVHLFYDTRRGHNTVKLNVTFKRKQSLYSTGIKIDASTWERLKKNADRDSPDGKIKDEDFLKLWCKLWNDPEKFRDKEPVGIILYARSITKKLGPNFDFLVFRERLEQRGRLETAPILADPNNVIKSLLNKSEVLRKDNRLGSASAYKDAAISFERFLNSFGDEERREYLNIPTPSKKGKATTDVVLRFEQITVNFLKLYEQWMLSLGRAPRRKPKPGEPQQESTPASSTTVGIYCRQLRSVYNDAIGLKIVSAENYPFGKNGYTIPAGSNIKKALSKSDVMKIIAYQAEDGSFEQRGRDIWVFSYLSNGMNITDICNLRWKDVDRKDHALSFIRQKTVRTRKGNQSRIRVKLFDESWNIINRYAQADSKADSFVFPFIKQEMTEQQKKNTVSQIVKMTNQHMRSIAKKLDISGDVSTYAARHSFATILLQSEAPIAFISQALGHVNISTTQAYLGSFDDEKTKKYLNALL